MSDFLLSLKDVSLAFGGPQVLDKVSLSIHKGLRAALTGRNGEGKSTLMKVIAGTLEPDTGEIVRAPGLKVVYVGQGVEDLRLETEDFRGRETLDDRPVSGLRSNVLSGHKSQGLPGLESQIPSGLASSVSRPSLALSGGQIRRKALEDAILSQPDLLLLDEPTNHLDIENIDWLEGMIRRQREMAVVIVTHDRRFLKRVATKILDLDRGELAGWECDYPTFVKRKQELLADEAVYWERKSKKLAQEEAWIRRGVKARTTRNEGRVAALLKLREEFAARRKQVGTATMKLDTAAAGGVRVLKIENLGFSWGAEGKGRTLDERRETLDAKGRETLDIRQVSGLRSNVLSGLSSQVSGPSWLFRSFTADVLRGERIGILGRNGAGKTTLLKLLTLNLKPTEGSVTLGTGVEMAFLDQLRGELNPELTVGENIASDRDEVIVGGVKKHVYSYLADFLFAPERVRTPVKALSGGERARLMLAKLFLKPANLLVMDEPTNDLDIETLELLEEQLLNYKGTLLLVSHDREFLDNVVTSTFVLEGDGQVRQYPGGYADYVRQRGNSNTEAQRHRAEEPSDPKLGAKPPDPSVSPCLCVKNKKLSYKEQRELDGLPAKIEALEQEIAAIEADLVAGKIYTSDRLAPAQAELEAAVERWAELEERSQILTSKV